MSLMDESGTRARPEGTAVLRALTQHGYGASAGFRDSSGPGLSPSALAIEASVSRPTVYAIRDLDKTVLSETPRARRSLLRLKADAGYALGVDIGEGHARVALADLNGQLFRLRSRSEIERGFNTGTAPEDVLDWISTAIGDILEAADVQRAEVLGIGVSHAAPISAVTHLPHPSGLVNAAWRDIDVADFLRRLLHWPEIAIVNDNDANLSALAELTVGALAGASHAIYVKWSNGIGAALVIQGEVYRGSRGYAGELGHFLVKPNASGPSCPRCGKTGCLAMTVGAASIAREFGISAAPEPTDQGLHGAAERLLDRLAKKDDKVLERLRMAAQDLAAAVVPTIDMLDPQIVLIGGGLGAHIHDHTGLRSHFRDALESRMMGFAQDLEIRRPYEHGHSAVHGATLLVLSERLLKWAQDRQANGTKLVRRA